MEGRVYAPLHAFVAEDMFGDRTRVISDKWFLAEIGRDHMRCSATSSSSSIPLTILTCIRVSQIRLRQACRLSYLVLSNP